MPDHFSFTDQINLLFEHRRRPDGHVYSLQEVGDATGISVPTLSQMRSGQNVNPRLNTLKPLAGFFGITLAFFESRTLEECLTHLYSDKKLPPPVTDLALRAAHLSPEAQQDLVRMVSWLVAAESNRAGRNALMTEFEAYEDE